uniref:Putative pre-mRNA-splicing factor ATP-dependent RNA helicase PRP1 isoform X4 n=1 Tax=Rhizophora mucronata TaxID=61149 RepID=A0A2P2L5G0_RHIMU
MCSTPLYRLYPQEGKPCLLCECAQLFLSSLMPVNVTSRGRLACRVIKSTAKVAVTDPGLPQPSWFWRLHRNNPIEEGNRSAQTCASPACYRKRKCSHLLAFRARNRSLAARILAAGSSRSPVTATFSGNSGMFSSSLIIWPPLSFLTSSFSSFLRMGMTHCISTAHTLRIYGRGVAMSSWYTTYSGNIPYSSVFSTDDGCT